MISDGVNCLFRHSVHGVWGDQLGDVEGVRVIGVLHAGGSPQRALDPGAVDLEGPITIAVFEDLPVGGIGQAGIGDTGLAAQFERLPRADSVQPLVDFGVHPGDEKRCHRMDLGQAVSGLPGLFHPGQVGVHHLAVPLHGEDQRNVDRNPFRQNGTDGGQTGLSGRDLDEKVRPVDDLPQLDCLLDRFSVSCASRGSTSIDTRPSTPSESSHWGTSTSHALRTSSVVTVRMVASTSAPRAASSAIWAS